MLRVLHFIPDDDKPAEILAALLGALPAGSYLVASHGVSDHNDAGLSAARDSYRASGVSSVVVRSSDGFARLAFAGLDMVPPGVVPVSDWRPASDVPLPPPAEVGLYGDVARKP